MTESRRRQIFVDHQVQGKLLMRAVVYWLCCLLSVSMMLVCWNILFEPPRPASALCADLLHRLGPPLLASLLVLPLVMADFVRLSNRFVAPICRLRRAMCRLADGENAAPLTFRETDFWTDLTDDFNRLAARIERQDEQSRQNERFTTDTGDETQPIGSAYDD